MELFNPGLFADQLLIQRHSGLNHQHFQNCDDYLQLLISQESSQLLKSHYFHKRFENIEISEPKNRSLDLIIDESLTVASSILKTEPDDLNIKYWFNLMQPGHITDWHSHDDLDELLSGVVYLVVPENSGELLFKTQPETRLAVVEGLYIFFDPAMRHAVSKNLSESYRLSIGMNFGRYSIS